MFDDLNKKEKIEDLFADTDKASSGQSPLKPAVFQPKQPSAFGEGVMGMDEQEASSSSKNKKIIVLAAIVLTSIVLVGGGIYAFSIFSDQAPASPAVTEEKNGDEAASAEDKNQPAEENGQAAENTEKNNQPASVPDGTEDNTAPAAPNNGDAPAAQKLDTDQDGIYDEEEESLGMDINNSDSDGDGLFDREEVRVYKTDPLQIDTDGDGFSDGEEVKNGYNPKGNGKLFQIK